MTVLQKQKKRSAGNVMWAGLCLAPHPDYICYLYLAHLKNADTEHISYMFTKTYSCSQILQYLLVATSIFHLSFILFRNWQHWLLLCPLHHTLTTRGEPLQICSESNENCFEQRSFLRDSGLLKVVCRPDVDREREERSLFSVLPLKEFNTNW